MASPPVPLRISSEDAPHHERVHGDHAALELQVQRVFTADAQRAIDLDRDAADAHVEDVHLRGKRHLAVDALHREPRVQPVLHGPFRFWWTDALGTRKSRWAQVVRAAWLDVSDAVGGPVVADAECPRRCACILSSPCDCLLWCQPLPCWPPPRVRGSKCPLPPGGSRYAPAACPSRRSSRRSAGRRAWRWSSNRRPRASRSPPTSRRCPRRRPSRSSSKARP